MAEFLDEFDVASHDAADFSFGAPDEGELLITALGDGLMPSNTEGSAGLRVRCPAQVRCRVGGPAHPVHCERRA